MMLGLSQEQLKTALEQRFQQLEEVEVGAVRADLLLLLTLAGALDVPISFFFDGQRNPDGEAGPGAIRPMARGFAEAQGRFGDDTAPPLHEAAELPRAAPQTADTGLHEQVLVLLRALAGFAEAQGGFGGAPSAAAHPAGAGVAPASVTRPQTTIAPTLAEALAAARARGEVVKQHLLTDPELLTTAQMAELLGMSVEGIRLKRKRHEILGIEFAKRGVRYPRWQVLDNHRVLFDLPRLFEILGDDSWRMFHFLQQHHAEAGGMTALEALRRGNAKSVLDAAENISVGAYS